MPNVALFNAAKLPAFVTLASVILSNAAKSPKFWLLPLIKPTPSAVSLASKLVVPVPPCASPTMSDVNLSPAALKSAT